jgi:hypothetical protein
VIDPRTGQLTLTYRADQGDDKRLIGAELAASTFENDSKTRVVTLRALENGAVVYAADVHRQAYEETKTDAWKQANGTEPAAVAKHILTQEWPATATTPDAGNNTETPANDNNAGA